MIPKNSHKFFRVEKEANKEKVLCLCGKEKENNSETQFLRRRKCCAKTRLTEYSGEYGTISDVSEL